MLPRNDNNDEIKVHKPILKPFNIGTKCVGVPEIININYDLWQLRITLLFENNKKPIYVTFENIRGFRVLDEGDLLEYWNANKSVDYWLNKVENGGWFYNECMRDGFAASKYNNYSEYFVTGINDCINIFTFSEPNIQIPE